MPLFFPFKACSTNNNLPEFITCTCILIQGIYNAGGKELLLNNGLIVSNVFSHWLYRNNSPSVPETTTCKSLDLVCHRYMLHSTFVSLTGGMELKVSLIISSAIISFCCYRRLNILISADLRAIHVVYIRQSLSLHLQDTLLLHMQLMCLRLQIFFATGARFQYLNYRGAHCSSESTAILYVSAFVFWRGVTQTHCDICEFRVTLKLLFPAFCVLH